MKAANATLAAINHGFVFGFHVYMAAFAADASEVVLAAAMLSVFSLLGRLLCTESQSDRCKPYGPGRHFWCRRSKMIVEKLERAGQGFLRCFLVIARTGVIVECVPRVVPFNFYLRMRCLDFRHIGLWNVLVLLAKMEQEGNFRGLLSKPSDLSTVVSHGSGRRETSRGQPRQCAAVTVAPHSSWFSRLSGRVLQGGVHIFNRIVDVNFLRQRDGLLHTIAGIGKLDMRFHTVEQRGSNAEK